MQTVEALVVSKCIFILCLLITDLDECAHNNGGCQGNCTNDSGSYSCTCDGDEVLDLNRHTCSGRFIMYNVHLQVQVIIKRINLHTFGYYYQLEADRQPDNILGNTI